jgi:transposase
MGSGCERSKLDRRDAAALAEACRVGAYRAVHRVSPAQRQVRQQLRVREALVATRGRLIAMVRALCLGEGIRLRRGAAQHFLRRLVEVELPPSLADTFPPVLALLRHLEDQLEIADRTIAQIAAHNDAVQRLMTAPGRAGDWHRLCGHARHPDALPAGRTHQRESLAPHRVENAGQAAREGDDRDPYAASARNVVGPVAQGRGPRVAREPDGPCGLHDQPAHARISGLS